MSNPTPTPQQLAMILNGGSDPEQSLLKAIHLSWEDPELGCDMSKLWKASSGDSLEEFLNANPLDDFRKNAEVTRGEATIWLKDGSWLDLAFSEYSCHWQAHVRPTIPE